MGWQYFQPRQSEAYPWCTTQNVNDLYELLRLSWFWLIISWGGKQGNVSTCSPALSSWRTRSSRSWAGKWRAPTSSSPSLCRVMVILRSCGMKHAKSLLLSNTSSLALDRARGHVIWVLCYLRLSLCVFVLLPCYPPGPPWVSESAPSPPRPAALLVLSSLSTAEPGLPKEKVEKKSEWREWSKNKSKTAGDRPLDPSKRRSNATIKPIQLGCHLRILNNHNQN